MELLLILIVGLQLYLAYWAWKNLPSSSGMSNVYRWAKIAAIGCAVIPGGGLFYQLIALAIAKASVARTESATRRLSAASTNFRTQAAPAAPAATSPAANPFASSPDGAERGRSAAGEPKVNPFADASSATTGSVPPAPVPTHEPEPPATDNPFL